jgi:hypothetical protein
MKKKIFGGIAVLAIAAVAVMNVNLGTKNNDLSAVSLANVEALAIEISSSGNWSVTILGTHSWRCDNGGQVCMKSIYKIYLKRQISFWVSYNLKK